MALEDWNCSLSSIYLPNVFFALALGSSECFLVAWPCPLAGLWTKDMKLRTNLAQPVIQKILKTLETRRLVKSVKNINNPSRKVFMLYELEPSRELTGGAWWGMGRMRTGCSPELHTLCNYAVPLHGSPICDGADACEVCRYQ